MVRYLYGLEQEFADYLARPDHKQEFVAEWQAMYNSFPDDMRDEDEAKAELHKEVEEMKEKLMDICDTREREAKAELHTLRNNQWLETSAAMFANAFICLLQVCIPLSLLLILWSAGSEGWRKQGGKKNCIGERSMVRDGGRGKGEKGGKGEREDAENQHDRPACR